MAKDGGIMKSSVLSLPLQTFLILGLIVATLTVNEARANEGAAVTATPSLPPTPASPTGATNGEGNLKINFTIGTETSTLDAKSDSTGKNNGLFSSQTGYWGISGEWKLNLHELYNSLMDSKLSVTSSLSLLKYIKLFGLFKAGKDNVQSATTAELNKESFNNVNSLQLWFGGQVAIFSTQDTDFYFKYLNFGYSREGANPNQSGQFYVFGLEYAPGPDNFFTGSYIEYGYGENTVFINSKNRDRLNWRVQMNLPKTTEWHPYINGFGDFDTTGNEHAAGDVRILLTSV
jgi:hypothetical protein